MTEKKQKLLQTSGQERDKVESTPKRSQFLSTSQVKDGKLSMTDKEFILRYATDEDCAAVRATIEKRLAGRPKHTYWICKNPKCGRGEMLGPDMKEPLPCFRCNQHGYKDSEGWLRPMTKKEAAQYEKDQAERFKRAVAHNKALQEKFKAIEEARIRGIIK